MLHQSLWFSFVCNTWQESYLFYGKLSPLPLAKVGEKIYHRKDNFLAMSYKQQKSQMKPVIMLSTFLGAYDVVHCKDDSKSVPAIVDIYNKHGRD